MSKRSITDRITVIEKIFFSSVVLLFSLMTVVQVLLTNDSWRNYLNFASRLEAQKIQINDWNAEGLPVSAEFKDGGYVILKTEAFFSLPNAYVLVNGREVKNFTSGTVVVPVCRGDIVEIDGTSYKKPFSVKVSSVSNNILQPQKNDSIEINHNIVTVAEVKLGR